MKKKQRPSAYGRDIRRTIRHERRRFLAIMLITLLGVMMFSGLGASCEDLRVSADRFFDEQNLHDLTVLSTLGLTDADVEALQSLDGISFAEGIYSEEVSARAGGQSVTVTLKTLTRSGIDRPYILEGALPSSPDETAATEKFMQDYGAKIGDTVTLDSENTESASHSETEDSSAADSESEDSESGGSSDADSENTIDMSADFSSEDLEKSSFTEQSFTITGVVTDVTDVDNPFGSVSYRTDSAASDVLFILPEAVDSDYYTAVVMTVDGASDLFCYSDSYENTVKTVRTAIEDSVRKDREDARSEEIRAKAQKRLDEEKSDAEEKLDDAKKELEDGEQELKDKETEGKEKISDGEQELADRLEDARKKLEDAQNELDTSLAEAADALNSAQKTLDSGAATLKEKKKELASAKKKLKSAEATLKSSKKKLAEEETSARKALSSAISKLKSGIAQIDEGLSKAEEGLKGVNASISAADSSLAGIETSLSETADMLAVLRSQASIETSMDSVEKEIQDLESKKTTLEAQKTVLETQKTALETQKAALEKQKTSLETREKTLSGQLSAAQKQQASAEARFQKAEKQIAAGEKTLAESQKKIADGEKEIAAAESRISAGQESIDEGLEKYESGKSSAESQIASGWEEYESGKSEGEQELADAREELAEGIADGRRELDDGWKEYNDALAEYVDRITDAQSGIDSLDTATWYIRDRSSLSGYANIKSDADSIEAIGTVFPIVFFVVAILISLTAVTRMVDEERGLIGTYKSLGYTDREISRKYIVYALTASGSGALLGTFCAFVVLPEFIFTIFSIMYLLPSYTLTFLPVSGLAGPAVFIAGILLAAYAALRAELASPPASLMRPKSPRAGSRVLLERVTPLWKRLSFLNKVTARNLFRYKKRMFMTIFGIAGCMALLLFGFAIKDSVSDLNPRQYEETIRYDLIAVASADDNENLLSYVAGDAESCVNALIDSAKISYGGAEISATLITVPDGTDMSEYVSLKNAEAGHGGTLRTSGSGAAMSGDLPLAAGDVYVTLNAGNVLGFEGGGAVSLQLSDLQRANVPVTALVTNYLGNYVYMTESTWEQYFEDYKPNGVLVNLKDSVTNQAAYAANLKEKEGVISATSTEELADQFAGAFRLINAVVVIVIGMSAALAFVVLFTLSTTNISEREREIATIKVLGFFDREVHLYIDKETVILTCIGILLGLPLGWAFAQTLTDILNLPSIYLAVSLHTVSYFYAAGLTLLFAFAVNLIMDRVLNRIDPALSLKSVE